MQARIQTGGIQGLAEVIVLFHGFLDIPVAFEAFGEDHKVARAETDGIFAVRNRNFTLDQKAGFLLCVNPVEIAGTARPDRPGLAGG